MLDLLRQPWSWYIAGPVIALVMFLLLYFGKSLGVSSNFRTFCTLCGGGKKSEFFNMDWKKQSWNLVFLLGAVIGGLLSHTFLKGENTATLSEETMQELSEYHINPKTSTMVPEEIFSFNAVFSSRGFITLIIGGFLVGFGTRYAGGCTSGHTISGLSNLQSGSLIATIGFFLGGLIMTYGILPYILKLN